MGATGTLAQTGLAVDELPTACPAQPTVLAVALLDEPPDLLLEVL